MPKLVILNTSAKGKEFDVPDVTIIGRLRTNPVAIEDSMASREHTKISKESDGYHVEDLKSRNGTLLNGNKIERNKLVPGDVVTVGRTEMRFEEGEVKASEDPTGPISPPAEEVNEEKEEKEIDQKEDKKEATHAPSEPDKVKPPAPSPGSASDGPSTGIKIVYIFMILIFFVMLLFGAKFASEFLIARMMETNKPAPENVQPEFPE